jgi:hypothetical protein
MLRATVIRPVCISVSPIWSPRPDFCYYQTLADLLTWGRPHWKRTGLSFKIADFLRRRSHSRDKDPRDSWSYFTVSDSRLLQPGGLGPHIYTPQEQGGAVIPPRTFSIQMTDPSLYRFSTDRIENAVSMVSLLLCVYFPQFVQCRAGILCRKNVFTAPRRSNGRPLWFCYSRFQTL